MADIKILNNDIVSFGGTVGIGTASPSHKLHVEGSVNITDDLTFGIGGFLGTSTSVFEMYSLGDIIYNTDSNNNGDSNHIFKESNNELMRITSAGNVGIGTTSPSAKLEVAGEIKSAVSSNNYALQVENTSESAFKLRTYVENTTVYTPVFRTGIYHNTTENASIVFYRGGSSTGGFLAFTTNDGTERMRIDSSGRVGIGRTPVAAALEVEGQIRVTGTSGYTFNAGGDTDGGMFSTADGTINFRTNGSERIRITSTGNVGIGTTAPSSKLQVDGDFNISNKYIYNQGTVATTGAGVANGSALTWKQGDDTINTAYNYRVRLTTSGTGTNSGATYLVEYDPDTTTYNVRMVSRSGSNSNHPLLAMSGSQMIAYTNHSTAYNIQYHTEAISVSDNDGTLHNMGADYHWQRDVNTLYYEDGNVGIGTDAPSAPLGISKSVYGDFDSENFFRIKIQDQGGTHNDVGIGQTATGNMGFNITSGGAFIFNNGTSGEIATFDGGGLNLYGDDGIVIRANTNGVGAKINFSDHSSGSYGQNGTLTYVHADGSSYGSGNAFIFSGTEPNMTVLADGKLMFTEGLYIKPSSGTGGGTRIIDSSGNFYGGGANITAINASNISSGTLSGDRLPWSDNDGFTGTYPIVWTATNGLYRSNWFQIRGSDDTILTRNINADGNIVLDGNLTGNLDNNEEGLSKIAGFVAETNAENGANQFIIPGVTENRLAGGSNLYTVSATKNGTAFNLSENVFRPNSNYHNHSVANSDTIVITITGASFNHSSGIGIDFSSRSWRARSITIESTTDGTNWTNRGSVTSYSESAYYVTFNTGSTATTGIRYTLTDFNTTSVRISNLIVNNYSGSHTYYVDKWYEDTKYNVLNIESSGGTDNYYLRFQEGLSDRFTIYENGNNVYFNGGPGNTTFRPRQNGGSGNFLINGSNVGIGTSSPSYKLSVNTNGDVYSADFYQDNSGTDKYNAIRVRGAMTSAVGYYGIAGSTASNPAFRDAFVMGTQSSHPLNLATNDTARLQISAGGYTYIKPTAGASRLYLEGTSGTHFLTGTSGGDLGFYNDTASSYRMFINSSGNVGIGTTSPNEILHVSRGSNGSGLLLENSAGGGGAYVTLDFNTYNVDQANFANYAASIRVIDNGAFGGDMAFLTKGSSIGASQTERLRIVASTGNVGIGVTDPLYKFEVDPNNSLDGSPPGGLSDTVARFGGSVIVESGKTLSLDDNYVTHAMMKYITANGEFKYQIQGYYGINFTTRSNDTKMIIRGNDGYVGINTTSPSERLHVNGNIQADTYIFGAYTNAIGYINADVHNWDGSTSTYNWVKIGSVNSSSSSTKLMVEINSWGDNNYPRQTTHHVTVSKYSVGLSLSNWKVAGSDYNSTLQLVVDSNLDVWVKRDINWNHRFLVKPLVVDGGATFNSDFTGSNKTTTQPTGTPVLENNGAFRVATSDLSTVTHDYRYQIIRTDGVENIRLEDNGDVALANGGGKVAVGKASPTYDLDVDGEVGINSYIRHNGDSDTFFGFDAANSFKVRTGGTDRFAVTSDVHVNGTTDLNINGTSRRINFNNGTGTIRTTTGNPLYLGSNSGTAVAIDSNQNVGIGETSVSGGDVSATAPRLHVRGVDTAGSYHLVGRFQAGNDSDNTGAAILINHSNDRGLLIRAGRKDSDRGVAYFDITSSGGGTTNMLTMGKYGSDHFVGIGTETPSAKLHISSGTSGDATLIIESDTDNNNENDNPQLQFKQDAGLTVAKVGLTGDAGTIFTDSLANAAYLGNDANAPLQLYTNATARLTILNTSGNVGIGTTNPVQPLQVDGNIYSNGGDIYVNNSKALIAVGDLVFKTYDTSYAERMRILANGQVGIGVTSVTSGYKMEVGGTIKANGLHGSTNVYGTTYTARYQQYFGALQISLESSTGSVGTIQLGNSGPNTYNNNVIITNGNLTVNGNGSFTGDVVAYSSSDKRLKDNVKPIENALDKVIAIGGYEFDWNDNQEVYEGHDVGVIAQEVEEVLPEVVETRKDGYKAVKYEKMVPLLIEAIKDQQKQIEELKALLNGSTK